MMQRLARLALVLLAVAVGTLATPAQAAKDAIYTSTFSDLALGGYDPVAYFTAGKPTEGRRAFETEWNGATWRFVSAGNRSLFQAAPEKYAPQYGGYCAWAVSEGYTASADPMAWRIVDGKLYVNYNQDIQKQWEQDIPGRVVKADTNWPKVLEK